MAKSRSFYLILILGSLAALAPFSIDMYLPGFKAIATDLNTTVPNVSLSLSTFFIGISAGQLLYGPLLDKFGRKKPLYFGLTLFIISSLSCLLVTHIDQLIVIRFIQAIGCCAASVAAIAMVRDLFSVEESPKVFASLMLVIAVSPMLAPTAGGYNHGIRLAICICLFRINGAFDASSQLPMASRKLQARSILFVKAKANFN